MSEGQETPTFPEGHPDKKDEIYMKIPKPETKAKFVELLNRISPPEARISYKEEDGVGYHIETYPSDVSSAEPQKIAAVELSDPEGVDEDLYLEPSHSYIIIRDSQVPEDPFIIHKVIEPPGDQPEPSIPPSAEGIQAEKRYENKVEDVRIDAMSEMGGNPLAVSEGELLDLISNMRGFVYEKKES